MDGEVHEREVSRQDTVNKYCKMTPLASRSKYPVVKSIETLETLEWYMCVCMCMCVCVCVCVCETSSVCVVIA